MVFGFAEGGIGIVLVVPFGLLTLYFIIGTVLDAIFEGKE